MAGMLSSTLQQPWLQRLTALVLVAYGALIGWLSLTPLPDGPEVPDKVLHVGAYGLFMGLSAPLVLVGSTSRLAWMAGAIFVYSGAIEVAQGFVPGRYPDGLDLIANGAGVFMACVGLVLVQRWFVPARQPLGVES